MENKPIITQARKLVKKGYNVIPVNSEKEPAIRTWSVDKQVTLENVDLIFNRLTYGVALLMGGNKGLTALDFDLKYSPIPEELYKRFCDSIPQDLRDKMYIQKTRNGGYHWIWSCPSQKAGNQKLAQRLTTPEEKHQVYLENFYNPVTKAAALKIALNYKVKVLLETRGHGGYVLFPPTPGYEYISGKIEEISLKEHDFILGMARSFNEYFEPSNTNKGVHKSGGINPFDEYDKRGDALGLLLNHGWTVVFENDRTVRLKRPGDDSSSSSALYDKNSKILNVFTTSTIFENGKGYSPASVFTVLECEGDATAAYRELCKLNFNVEENGD